MLSNFSINDFLNDDAILLKITQLRYDRFYIIMQNFLELILQFFVNFYDYSNPGLLFTRMMTYIENFQDISYEMLVKRILEPKLATYLNCDTVNNLNEIEKILRAMFSNDKFLKAYNDINNNYKIKSTLYDTKEEMCGFIKDLRTKLYYLYVDVVKMNYLKKYNSLEYKRYSDKLETLEGLQDCYGNIYVAGDCFGKFSDLADVIIHELAHVKHFRSTEEFYEFSDKKLIFESGDYFENNTYMPYATNFLKSLDVIYIKKDNTDMKEVVNYHLNSFFEYRNSKIVKKAAGTSTTSYDFKTSLSQQQDKSHSKDVIKLEQESMLVDEEHHESIKKQNNAQLNVCGEDIQEDVIMNIEVKQGTDFQEPNESKSAEENIMFGSLSLDNLKICLKFTVPKGFKLVEYCKGTRIILKTLDDYLRSYREKNGLNNNELVDIPESDVKKMPIFKEN
jgi:hypothetical protein